MARHLLVTNDFPPKTGGIQVYLEQLWGRLEPGRAVVLTASSHPETADYDANSDLPIERVAARTLYLPTRRNLRAIEDAIARHDPELVLLDPAWPLGLLGPHLSRPYGVVLHGAEVTIPARLPFVAATLRRVLRGAAVVVAAGRYVENEARRCAAESMAPVVQVPPGVDCERFEPSDTQSRRATREHYGLDEENLVVTSYSRLVPRKGMDTLIRASASLVKQFPSLVVMIGGSGRDRRRLEKLAQRLGAPVRFMGRVPDDELVAWLGAGDMMVMDCRSRWLGLEQEGFGIVFAEAAACGIPSVAGRSGGSHEAVEDSVSGLVVSRPRRSDDLEEAMSRLLSDVELRHSMGRAARQVATERFDWSALTRVLDDGLAPFDGGVSETA